MSTTSHAPTTTVKLVGLMELEVEEAPQGLLICSMNIATYSVHTKNRTAPTTKQKCRAGVCDEGLHREHVLLHSYQDLYGRGKEDYK